MAYCYDCGYRSRLRKCNNCRAYCKQIDAPFVTEIIRTNCPLNPKCYCRIPRCNHCHYCDCGSCTKDTHKFIAYTDVALSSTNLIETDIQTKNNPVLVICTKANVSVQSSPTDCSCNKKIFPTEILQCPSCDKLQIEDQDQNTNEIQGNQVPIVTTCFQKTEVCKSICSGGNHCFNYEKSIDLNPCNKNVNINLELKVKKKKTKRCQCNKCCNENNFDEQKTCDCNKKLQRCKCDLHNAVIVRCPVQDNETDLNKCPCANTKPVVYDCFNSQTKTLKEMPKCVKICTPSQEFQEVICDLKESSSDNNDDKFFLYTAKPLESDDVSKIMQEIKCSRKQGDNSCLIYGKLQKQQCKTLDSDNMVNSFSTSNQKRRSSLKQANRNSSDVKNDSAAVEETISIRQNSGAIIDNYSNFMRSLSDAKKAALTKANEFRQSQNSTIISDETKNTTPISKSYKNSTGTVENVNVSKEASNRHNSVEERRLSSKLHKTNTFTPDSIVNKEGSYLMNGKLIAVNEKIPQTQNEYNNSRQLSTSKKS